MAGRSGAVTAPTLLAALMAVLAALAASAAANRVVLVLKHDGKGSAASASGSDGGQTQIQLQHGQPNARKRTSGVAVQAGQAVQASPPSQLLTRAPSPPSARLEQPKRVSKRRKSAFSEALSHCLTPSLLSLATRPIPPTRHHNSSE